MRKLRETERDSEANIPHFRMARSFLAFCADSPTFEAISWEIAVWMPAPYMVKQIP